MQRCPPRSADRCPRAAHRALLASRAPLKNRDPELACASNSTAMRPCVRPSSPSCPWSADPQPESRDAVASHKRDTEVVAARERRYWSVSECRNDHGHMLREHVCMKSARPRSRSSLVSGTPSCPNRLLPHAITNDPDWLSRSPLMSVSGMVNGMCHRNARRQ